MLKKALPIDALEKVKIQSKKQKGIATYWIEPELILICD